MGCDVTGSEGGTKGVELIPVLSRDWPELKSMYKQYIHELSQYLGDSDQPKSIPPEWLSGAEGLCLLHIVQKGVPVGFILAMARSYSESIGVDCETDHFLYDMFVGPGARRQGIGLWAAKELFRLLPGHWGFTWSVGTSRHWLFGSGRSLGSIRVLNSWTTGRFASNS